jgi:hypothetical protein
MALTLIRCPKEYFADYAPLLPSLFSLNHVPTEAKPLYGSSPNSWDPKALERTVQGITAVLLSLKKKPVIRFEKMSGMARKLAVEMQVRSFLKLPFSLLTLPPLVLSTNFSPKQHYLTFDPPKFLLCYSFSTGGTTLLRHFCRNGHIKQWFTNFSVSRMGVLISLLFLIYGPSSL